MLPRVLLCSMEQKSFPCARATQRGGSRKQCPIGDFRESNVLQSAHGRAAEGWRRKLTTKVVWIETSSDPTSRATLKYTLHHSVVPIWRQVKWTVVLCANVLLITGCRGRGGERMQEDSLSREAAVNQAKGALGEGDGCELLEANICQSFCLSAWNRIWSVYCWHQTESLSCAIRSSSFSY